MDEKGVGVTAGFFSTIKKIECKFSEGTPSTCPTHFVVKAWPEVSTNLFVVLFFFPLTNDNKNDNKKKFAVLVRAVAKGSHCEFVQG